MPYWIRVNRYFVLDIPLNEIHGMNQIGKWAVLEYDDSLESIANYLSTVEQATGTGLYEWLWKDALHSHQQNWTLKEQIIDLHRQAREDIDALGNLEQTVLSHLEKEKQRVFIVLEKIKEINSSPTSKKEEKE